MKATNMFAGEVRVTAGEGVFAGTKCLFEVGKNSTMFLFCKGNKVHQFTLDTKVLSVYGQQAKTEQEVIDALETSLRTACIAPESILTYREDKYTK